MPNDNVVNIRRSPKDTLEELNEFFANDIDDVSEILVIGSYKSGGSFRKCSYVSIERAIYLLEREKLSILLGGRD